MKTKSIALSSPLLGGEGTILFHAETPEVGAAWRECCETFSYSSQIPSTLSWCSLSSDFLGSHAGLLCKDHDEIKDLTRGWVLIEALM